MDTSIIIGIALLLGAIVTGILFSIAPPNAPLSLVIFGALVLGGGVSLITFLGLYFSMNAPILFTSVSAIVALGYLIHMVWSKAEEIKLRDAGEAPTKIMQAVTEEPTGTKHDELVEVLKRIDLPVNTTEEEVSSGFRNAPATFVSNDDTVTEVLPAQERVRYF